MKDLVGRTEIYDILINNGFPKDILNNPVFMDYLIQKFKESFVILDDNGRLILQKINDVFRNDGLRNIEDIRFKIGSIISNNQVIDGFYIEETSEVRNGDFLDLSNNKWDFSRTLYYTNYFYNKDGVLLQKQTIEINNKRTRYLNGLYGIEAFNSFLSPYDSLYGQLSMHKNGLFSVHKIIDKYYMTITRRNPQNYDQIHQIEIVNGYKTADNICNNSSNIFDIKPSNMYYTELEKNNFYDKIIKINEQWSDAKKSIYNYIINQMNLRYENNY